MQIAMVNIELYIFIQIIGCHIKSQFQKNFVSKVWMTFGSIGCYFVHTKRYSQLRVLDSNIKMNYAEGTGLTML